MLQIILDMSKLKEAGVYTATDVIKPIESDENYKDYNIDKNSYIICANKEGFIR